ncbi:MAG: hypothetical protein GF419_04930 [Ignavibacteriales bacterium]|nr:hypothetical protein [Ignavibacteriales bacterium]
MRLFTFFGVAVAVLSFGNITNAQPTNVGGVWIVESGEAPDGSRYAGSVSFSPLDDRHIVSRQTPKGTSEGVGVYLGDAIGTAFGAGAAELALYRVGGGGVLEGVWIDESGNRGTERAVPAAEGGSVFTVSGVYPDNNGMYSGSLTIDERNERLDLEWKLGTASSNGVGFRFGEYLVALRGAQSGYRALALYVFKAGRADGAILVPSSDRLGSERLAKAR